MTITYKWYDNYDNGKMSAGISNHKFYARIYRKSAKTKRYWFGLWTKGNNRSNFCSGNMLDIDNAFVNNAAEAKEHYTNAINGIIAELQEIKAEIQQMEIHD